MGKHPTLNVVDWSTDHPTQEFDINEEFDSLVFGPEIDAEEEEYYTLIERLKLVTNYEHTTDRH